MTEMRRKELLNYLREWAELYIHEANCSEGFNPETIDNHRQAYQQIRQIIEQGEQGEPCFSPVPEEGIEEKSEKRIPDPLALKQAIEVYEELKRAETGLPFAESIDKVMELIGKQDGKMKEKTLGDMILETLNWPEKPKDLCRRCGRRFSQSELFRDPKWEYLCENCLRILEE